MEIDIHLILNASIATRSIIISMSSLNIIDKLIKYGDAGSEVFKSCILKKHYRILIFAILMRKSTMNCLNATWVYFAQYIFSDM